MSYKVKPEDVTNKLLDDAYMNILSEDDSEMRHDIAAIINAAIEAGLVSPPCWEVVMEEGTPSVAFKSRKSADAWAAIAVGSEVRHYKGQTS